MASSSKTKLPPTAWEAGRRTTRQLESQLDSKLTQYSSLATAIARGDDDDNHNGKLRANGWPRSQNAAAAAAAAAAEAEALEEGASSSSSSTESAQRLEGEISSLLSKMHSSLASLTQLLDDPDVPPSTIQQHAVQRHREVLSDFERDFRRCKDNVRHAIDRRDLVGKVRGDIDAYKAAHASDQEALLAERGRLDNSHSMIDGTLEQAYATLTDFRSQRQILNNVANRMTNTAAQVPALNGIMTMIGRRRRRDSIIMGTLIGSGVFLLLLYMTR